MISLAYLFVALASADRVGFGVDLGPSRIQASYHRPVYPTIEGGVALGGSQFTVNDCGLVYLDPNSTTGSFECTERSVWSIDVDVEGLYRWSIKRLWGYEPILSMGPYIGIGFHSQGVYERAGALTTLRMNWEPIDLGVRVQVGHHGLLRLVWGAGVFASLPIP